MNDKLLPCPFCGSEVEIFDEEISYVDTAYNFHCKNCDMITYYDYPNDRDEAIKHWNTRKPMERIVEILQSELELADEEKERCLKENPLQFDTAKGYATGISNALDVIKGGVDNAG